MNLPHDQSARDRFVHELERNFSVVASAGSGKTRAITDRIVALAKHERAAEWLPSLAVVTYTNRAAAEMQQRARLSILEAGVKLEVINAFNRAFFGTIHSLCLKLLRQHGHYLGLPAQLEHLDEEDDAALWTEFVQSSTAIGAGLDPDQRRALLRLTPARRLLDLGRRGHVTGTVPAPEPFPTFDFGPVYAFVPKKVSLAAVTRVQEAMRRWENAWAGDGFVGPLPGCKSDPLKPIWEAALAPIVSWRRRAALYVAAEIAQAYREFRLGRGVMTFSDQVALAAELLRHAEAARRIRTKQYRIILDEAQDTDPTQFDVLLEAARPVEATGSWPHDESHPPRPGHFCMVGDFQQSIYGARADLAHYRRVHDAFLRTGAGEELTFSVTFRLDRAGIEFANAVFPIVLHGLERQVPYVELYPRPTVFPGQIIRFETVVTPEISGERAMKKMYWEAHQLAHWLRDAGLEKLRASSWREVAVLCPRTRWLAPIRAALRAVGLKAQVQSERAIKGDSPAYAWFTALVTVLAEPRNGFEIVGVLREVFGLSDQDLAAFSEGYGDRFRLTAPSIHRGPVAEKINLLAALRERARSLPLFSAMEEMIQVTQLRDRLRSLPKEDFDGLDFELDELLTQAATAEAGKTTLESFATELQAGFHASRDVRGALPDAVQIISGHKAKGSEWEAVIIPFFARGVTVRHAGYPRLLRDPRTAATVAALESSDIDGDLKAAVSLQDKQELERLLYVALTRAKHTLVIVDDRSLFRGKKGKLPEKSQALLLGCDNGDGNAKKFEALPTALTACPDTARSHADKAAVRSQEMILPLPKLPAKALKTSRERAAVFLKRNPSALAEAALAEADPAAYQAATRQTVGAPNAGQRYGTWWHAFVEVLDWSASVVDWGLVFAERLADSPDPARSRHDWSLLREQLANGSNLARLLTTPGVLAHAEMPFLWAMSERECLDGIIDLAIYDPVANRWTILDWKTNRVPPSRSHYLPQLSAYWKAASEMLRTPVDAGLYITATGEWLPYEESELAGTWETLRQSSAALTQALEDDRGDG